MGITIFVVCNDSFILQGIELLVKEHNLHKIKIKQCRLFDLMSLERSTEPVIIYAPEQYLKIIDTFIQLDKHVVVSNKITKEHFLKIINNIEKTNASSKIRLNWKEQSLLTTRERRYCYYVYKGMSNKQVSRWLLCSAADVSYLKKKVMKKWNCQNRVQLYHVIRTLFGDVYH